MCFYFLNPSRAWVTLPCLLVYEKNVLFFFSFKEGPPTVVRLSTRVRQLFFSVTREHRSRPRLQHGNNFLAHDLTTSAVLALAREWPNYVVSCEVTRALAESRIYLLSKTRLAATSVERSERIHIASVYHQGVFHHLFTR